MHPGALGCNAGSRAKPTNARRRALEAAAVPIARESLARRFVPAVPQFWKWNTGPADHLAKAKRAEHSAPAQAALRTAVGMTAVHTACTIKAATARRIARASPQKASAANLKKRRIQGASCTTASHSAAFATATTNAAGTEQCAATALRRPTKTQLAKTAASI